MGKDAILVLQGGGALGAYECGAYGAYKVLAPYFDRHGYSLSVVAGTSIGAINATVIATRYNKDSDRGVRALEHLWTRQLTAPYAPFFPPLPVFDSYNAIWTSLLFGNPHLFSPYFFGWTFFAPIFWDRFIRFYDMETMRRTLEEQLAPAGEYKGAEPRLVVTAVDIESGLPNTFDSGQEAVTVDEVMASCALPPWLPHKSCAGHHYWDGGLSSNTPLREALSALQSETSREKLSEEYDVFIISVIPQKGELPKCNWEVWSRINQITFGDKTEYDERMSNAMNSYLDFVKAAQKASHELPASSPLKKLIEDKYKELRAEGRVRLNITRIQRQALPGEETSREIDFSGARIEALISQGIGDAHQVLKQAAK
jgi:NTE family protein